MPRLYIKTLGCKVNTFDSHALASRFQAEGFELVEAPETADVTVVNTCSVTANADREARYLARRLRREAPDSLLVYTGCYAQTDSAVLAAMDEIDFVVPNEAKDRLIDVVREGARLPGRRPEDKLPDGVKVVAGNRQAHFKSAVTFFDKAGSEAMTRAFLKIQDGCDSFCTYCLIPYARGASRSVPPEQVLAEVERLAEVGAPEIVLTGIHIGDYGRDLLPKEEAERSRPIVPLLAAMLKLPGVNRIRISSLEPSELSEELVELMAAHKDRFCDHLHLPLQSGSDRILKLMRRSYTKAEYAAAVARLREVFPEASLGADVIPGFPGETPEEHRETLDFVRELGLSYLHVFPYSKRPNTAAARMPGHLDGGVVKQRAAELRALSTESAQAYARRFIGRSLPVLWERDVDESGRRLGLTRNYLNVVAAGDAQPAAGSITQASVKGFGAGGRLLARPLEATLCQDLSFPEFQNKSADLHFS